MFAGGVAAGFLIPVLPFVILAMTAGCATVPQNRRVHLADPMMAVTDEPLDTKLPQIDLDDAEAVARFAMQHRGLDRARLVR